MSSKIHWFIDCSATGNSLAKNYWPAARTDLRINAYLLSMPPYQK